MNCYSNKKRIEICKNYEVKLISHNMNFSDKPIKSDTGYAIKNDYCIFSVKNRNINTTIICGSEAFNHFAEILNIKIPPIIYNCINNNNLNKTIETKNSFINNNQIKWNAITKQFYIAISLFIDYFNIQYNENNYIYELKNKKYKYYYKEPYPSEIHSVNSILIKFKTSMPTILNKVKNKIKIDNCDFTILAKIFSKNYPNENQFFV